MVAPALTREWVTEFFRTPRVWHHVRQHLADLAEDAGRPALRAWSGGCCSGEEAYSMAFAALDAGHSCAEIVGTDLHESNIARARRGRYDLHDVARDVGEGRMPPAGTHRWLKVDQRTNSATVRDPYRRLVRFETGRLGIDPPPVTTGLDVALVRNVWRHLAAAEQAVLAEQTHRALVDRGGVLILGGADLALPNGRGGLMDWAPAGLRDFFTESAAHALVWQPR